MHWMLYASAAVITFTAMNLLQRRLAVRSGHSRATAVLFVFWGIIWSLFLFLFQQGWTQMRFPTSLANWITIGSVIVLYGIFERYRFTVSKMVDASTLTTIGSVSVLVAFLGSLFVYGESWSVTRMIGGGLIIVALLFVAVRKGKSHLSLKHVGAAVGLQIVLGLAWMLDKAGAMMLSAEFYSIVAWGAPFVFLLWPTIRWKTLRREIHVDHWRVMLLAGLNVIGFFFQLKAFELADATQVIPVVQVTSLATALLGIALLRERDHMVRKIFAAGITSVGVVFLVR